MDKATKKQLVHAFGYFCYLAGVIFFLCGAGFTALLGYQMFSGEEGTILITLMFPIGPILLALGYAVFQLGRNIHNPPPPEDFDLKENDEAGDI